MFSSVRHFLRALAATDKGLQAFKNKALSLWTATSGHPQVVSDTAAYRAGDILHQFHEPFQSYFGTAGLSQQHRRGPFHALGYGFP